MVKSDDVSVTMTSSAVSTVDHNGGWSMVYAKSRQDAMKTDRLGGSDHWLTGV